MGKQCVKEAHSISIVGVLDINDDGSITISIEDKDEKDLATLLTRFSGEEVSLTVKQNTEL